MDEHRDPLSGATLDRELRRVLTVDPSPDFTARVRMRVASETMTSPWWALPWQSGAAIAAVAVAAALVIVIGARPQPDVRATPQQVLNTAPSPATSVESEAAAAPPHPAPAHPAPAHRAPEVLVPPGEEQAIRMFAASVWTDQRPAPDATIAAGDEPLQIAPVDITPLDIEPLPQVAALEGERP